ncbi:DUF6807 family protein [Cyclobacterium plantarum]|uniref:Methane oxygenase PmoA n=1 Tax=Cyclobacterium plantarum TaxID=2716263 RepID=A0ABX0HBE8_9BACT|nr:DUF6807 family protein [Cyclobacterium plantarum]NHE58690.1 hypothetical protein [Cyclobacterium plantarum]
MQISWFSFSKVLFSLFILVMFIMDLEAQTLTFEEQDEGWLLLDDGKPRYFYQAATKSLDGKYPRANYIHPLYDTDGEVVTEDFPADHPHHRGIFWTWHQLWVRDQRAADPWVCENIIWEVKRVKTSIHPNGAANLEAKVLWKGTGPIKKNIVEETLIISYQRISSSAYKLVFDITLKPLVREVRLGGSEDPKGYGGFSPRIKLAENVGFYDENGAVVPQDLAVQAGPWINVTREKAEDPGVVIMGEPDRLPSYQGWILRSENSMQNMAFPGREAMLLSNKSPYLRFKNQLLVHQGLGNQEIVNQYRIFKNQP